MNRYYEVKARFDRTLADYEIVSIKETPILDVFPYVEKGGGQ